MNSGEFDPGPLAEVRWQASGERPTLIFARDLGHAPEKVWAVLHRPEPTATMDAVWPGPGSGPHRACHAPHDRWREG